MHQGTVLYYKTCAELDEAPDARHVAVLGSLTPKKKIHQKSVPEYVRYTLVTRWVHSRNTLGRHNVRLDTNPQNSVA
jgi:hypothetical protein